MKETPLTAVVFNGKGVCLQRRICTSALVKSLMGGWESYLRLSIISTRCSWLNRFVNIYVK